MNYAKYYAKNVTDKNYNSKLYKTQGSNITWYDIWKNVEAIKKYTKHFFYFWFSRLNSLLKIRMYTWNVHDHIAIVCVKIL